MDARGLLALLPWRHPFLMVDRMVECAVHERIVTLKNVTAGDPLGGPAGGAGWWLPGIMLFEGLGQSAALLFRLSYPNEDQARLPLLGFLSARLYRAAATGEAIEFEVRAVKMTRRGGVFAGQARIGQEVIAEAELAFGGGGST